MPATRIIKTGIVWIVAAFALRASDRLYKFALRRRPRMARRWAGRIVSL